MSYIYGPAGRKAHFEFKECSELYSDLISKSLNKLVSDRKIGWLLLDDALLRLPIFKDFGQGVAPKGWRLMALQTSPRPRLMLFERN